MIRKIKIEDYKEIKDLFYQVLYKHLNHRPDINTDENPIPFNMFEQMIVEINSYNIVYEEKGKIVGCLFSTEKFTKRLPGIKEKHIFYIDTIVVDDTMQHRGIGTKLYNNLKDEALSKGAESIELQVWSFNEEAIHFYETLGMSVKNFRMEENISNKINTKTTSINMNVTKITKEIK